jgi:hypothetical protein
VVIFLCATECDIIQLDSKCYKVSREEVSINVHWVAVVVVRQVYDHKLYQAFPTQKHYVIHPQNLYMQSSLK